MIYALYYKNKLIYKNACKDITTFKKAFNKRKNEFFKTLNYNDEFRNFSRLFNKKFNCRVEGWEIRTYKNYKQVTNIIKTEAAKTKRRNKKKAYNYFYVFDTESTNVNNKFALTYLYGIRKYNYNYYMNDETIEDYAEEYKAFYGKNAIAEFSNFIFNINQEALKNDELVYVYVHNLIYDLYELIQNIFARFTFTDEDYINAVNDSVFRGSATKPLRYRFKNIVFADSLALTNKSLKKISKNHTIKKLEELKTYKEQFFIGSELPEEELLYNKNDLDVTALGIMDSIRSLKTEFETFNDYIQTYAYTVTGISKYLNKNMYSDTDINQKLIREHTARASRNLPTENKTVDKKRLLFYQDTFQGGFTHCNPFIAYNTELNDINNIYISFDKKSHYPATMTERFFPYDFEVIDEEQTEILIDLHNENLKRLNFDNTDNFINNMLNYKMEVINNQIYNNYFIPCKNSFICEVELRDLQVKFFNHNCMPLIACSKTNLKPKDYFNKNFVIDNGKILKAKKIKIKCTEIDLLSYSMFYEFEIINCCYLEVARYIKYADDYIQKSIRFHLVNKIEISSALKKEKRLEELRDFSGAPIFTQTQINNFNQMSTHEQNEFLKTEYQATKTCGLNNQYGINVQKIINDNISFDLQTFQFTKDYEQIQGCQGVQTTRDYITGLYITAYARLDLAFMSFLVFNKMENAQVCYWDTDSLKIKIQKNQEQELNNIFEFYNKKIQKVIEQCESYNGILNNIGIWEFDGKYKFFYSMGAKKYVVCKYDKELKKDIIEVTNAGINKKQFSEYLTEKYDKFKKYTSEIEAFKALLNSSYHPNLKIGTDITGRKTIKYPYIHEIKINEKFIDENGKQIKVNQFSTALITDCDYLLNAIDGFHVSNRQHYQLCRRLQLNEGINFKCNINPETIGKVSEIYNDEFSNFSIDF